MTSGRREDGYLPIAAYGVIGDCRSVALVGVDGSIDWCCLPRFDSPSVFGRLIDGRRGGHWQIAPTTPYECRQEYADRTNILRTLFQTEEGLAVVTDFMPVREVDIRNHARPHSAPRIVRMVTGLAGTTRMRSEVSLRPGYGLHRDPLRSEDGRLHGDAGDHHYCMTSSIQLRSRSQSFTVGPGETVAFSLISNDAGQCGSGIVDVESARRLLRSTQQFWWRWIDQCTYTGPYLERVQRSALVLKLLTYSPTGAIVAAPTTSLPEWIGGPRNWDYRYTWLRDASFTLYALFQLGFRDEAEDFMHWVGHLTLRTGLKNLYTLDGQNHTAESEIPLSGYRGSRPVRLGNGAADQLQLDVYGELLDCAWLYVLNGGDLSDELWTALVAVVEFAAANWDKVDASIWEVRGDNLHFTYSKAMCWVALDRGIRIARRTHRTAPRGWRTARDRVHAAVMKHGYSTSRRSFVQAFGSDALDAAGLRLVQMGFLPNQDRRLRTTIRAIDEELSEGPLLFRYKVAETDDGLDSPEGSFIICAFWLADALAITGQLEAAERRFERLLSFASPLGLFAEEVHPRTGAFLGNFPQAFSHLALISAAVNIERRRNNTLTRTGKP